MAIWLITWNVTRMVWRRALERWETNLANCKVTPQTIWPIAKPLSIGGGPKAPSAIHVGLGPIFYRNDRANIIADCLETWFRAHDLCDYHHRWHLEAQVEVLLATEDEDIPVHFQPYDVSKKHNPWCYERSVVLMAFQINVSGIFQDDLLCI
jgi:hypothetical protein